MQSNKIVVLPQNVPFSLAPHAMLDDERISMKAKGVLMCLLRKPEGWKWSVAELESMASDGETSLRSAINELRAFGYAQLTAVRDQGTIQAWVWEVSADPVFAHKTE